MMLLRNTGSSTQWLYLENTSADSSCYQTSSIVVPGLQNINIV